MTAQEIITRSELMELLHYNPETGLFISLKNYPRRKRGEIAGKKTNTGHILMSVKGRAILAHRLAWFYMTGEWPNGIIDHIDRNSANNRWSNLRQATHRLNGYNSGVRKNNKTGFKGVTLLKRQKKKYQASLSVDGRVRVIGTFYTPEEASDAYNAVAKEVHGEFYFDTRLSG